MPGFFPSLVLSAIGAVLFIAAAWKYSRARREHRAARAAGETAHRQTEALLGQADCLIWEADVEMHQGQWAWKFSVRRSGLYRRLFGDWMPTLEKGLWYQLTIPEQKDMDDRARTALERAAPGYEQEFRALMGERELWLHENVSISPAGVQRWHLVGLVTDATARHVAEEARRASERELTHLLGQADCLIWRANVSRDGDTVRWHSFHMPESVLKRRLFGERPDASGSKLWSLITVPDLPQMNQRSREAILASVPGYTQEFSAIAQGKHFWLREQVVIAASGPDTWQLVGVIVDITARREAEASLRASEARMAELLQRADCLLWQSQVHRQPDGNLHWKLYLPDSILYRRLFGEPPTDPPTLFWRKLGVPEIDEMRQRAREAIASSAAGYEQEFRVPRANGGFHWLREQVAITPAGEGEWNLVGVITDVTGRREAELAGRANEERMLRILSVADCMLWEAVVDLQPDGTLLWNSYVPQSELFVRLYGTEHATTATPRIDWTKLKVPEVEEIDLRAESAIRTGARGYEQQFRVVKPEGTIWLHEQVTIMPAGAGKWNLVGVVVDHTARRAAEDLVRASETRYRSLLQHAPVAIVEADFAAVGRWMTERRAAGITDLAAWFAANPRQLVRVAGLVSILAVNDETLALFHAHSRRDFARKLRRIMLPDTFRVLREALVLLWNGGNTLAAEMEMRDFSGRPRRVHLRWWIGRADGAVDLSQSVIALVDLTELQETEAALAAEKERLAVTLRAMAEGVVTTDIEGRVQFINPAAERMLQVSALDAAGRSLPQLMALRRGASTETVHVPFAEVARGDAVVEFPPHTELTAPDGRQRIVEGCCAPVHSADSTVVGTVVVFRDVTERERLEQEVIRASKLESVGLLAGGIAHDFNNILTVVTGNLSLALLDVEPASELAQSLREVERASLRARELTQQLLTFAKGGEPVRAAVHLPGIVREVALFSLHGSPVRAEFDLPEGLWPVNADRGQISRVVQNLVINAAQAMPEGGVVRLSAHNITLSGLGTPRLPAGDYVHIAIADTGVGIRPEHVSRVFDPYFTTKQSGSGLGLAAVYSIVSKHKGIIDVESTLGRGTTMHLWLPSARGATVEEEAAPSSAPPAPLGGRVLFLDDEEPIRRMAATIFKRLGLHADLAADGRDAVEKYESALRDGRRYDVVIVDLTIPGGMGGREAFERIRALDPRAKGIVSSGYSSDTVIAHHRDHGFAGRVAKPYELTEFAKVLRDVLSG